MTYSKMTFILSVIGFIGSLGFYTGVLREVYSKPDSTEAIVIELKRENEQLKSKVNDLTYETDKSKKDE
ncbi:MAG: hypothetical protein JKY09_09015 [Crocinitomicaceae bacterium]|nr:hypothetical protein [Crocinitomicaceae bacterium]